MAKISQLDESIKKLQDISSTAMVNRIDNLIISSQHINSLMMAQEKLSKMQILVVEIPNVKDKRSVGIHRDAFEEAIQKINNALKIANSNEKTIADIMRPLNDINDKIKIISSMQIKRINDEDENMRDEIENLSSDIKKELTYIVPRVEKEVSIANNNLKSTTDHMGSDIGIFSGTNAILAHSAYLAMHAAAIELQINSSLNERIISDFNAVVDAVHNVFAKTDDLVRILNDLLTKGGYQSESKLLNEASSALIAVREDYAKIAAKMRILIMANDDLEKFNAQMRSIVMDEINKGNQEVSNANIRQETAVHAVHSASTTTMTTIITAGAVSIAISLLLGIGISQSVSRDLKTIEEQSAKITEQSLNLGVLIESIRELTGNANRFSADISSSIEEQAAVSSDQSASVTEITTTMEELSTSAIQIANHANKVKDFSDKALAQTTQGASAVEILMSRITEIAHENEINANEIAEIGKKFKEINKIMTLINNIADQTKLIAFNAALEASSAGDAGRRFGVVAVEIRRLADTVMESTQNIQSHIEENQKAINHLVIQSEEGGKKSCRWYATSHPCRGIAYPNSKRCAYYHRSC